MRCEHSLPASRGRFESFASGSPFLAHEPTLALLFNYRSRASVAKAALISATVLALKRICSPIADEGKRSPAGLRPSAILTMLSFSLNLCSRFGGNLNENCSTGCPWDRCGARRLWSCVGPGLADPQCDRGGTDPRRRRQRHHRPRGVRAGRQAGRADLRDRESARGRWYDRRQHGRQGRARRRP